MPLLRKIARLGRLVIRWRKPILCLSLSAVYFYSNLVGVYAAEANFWSQRKRAAQKFQDRSGDEPSLRDMGMADAGLRAGLTAEQSQLLAQLPTATHFDFGAADNVSVTNQLANQPASKFSTDAVKPSSKDSPSWLSTLILPYGSIRDIYLSRTPNSPLVIHV